MQRKIKILPICTDTAEKCDDTEKILEDYINDGWQIITASATMVILEKDIIETSG